jgi:hypothetical protein
MMTTANTPNPAYSYLTLMLCASSGPNLELAWRGCLDRVDAPAHHNAPGIFSRSQTG